jgi:hypothetical protein
MEVPDSLAAKAFWLDVWDQLDEILKYKWIESERAGFDIGMDRGIREWLHNHFTAWAAAHPSPQNPAPPSQVISLRAITRRDRRPSPLPAGNPGYCAWRR